ncbi:imidazole glycerol phosphate synthase subunit HisH [Tepidibacillus fermentans]|uniref:Imidazole glycerol phosphate synthase subunit HisH n=1 Tax=Tepidibacillus fermentans TaxID=1281767 RepID=A0A4R3KGK6_9BACI|nr:imidazole glycerol phosphate synthase subunit HisH [Tepidibacillus fermentans]TCS81801.1 glutamine amidotransferase [Tepidibacillus fermentans]
MIAIIDYGMGNLHSVQKALERLGFEAKATDGAKEILSADKVILPGVGAFGDAMENLRKKELIPVIHQLIEQGTPFLGICLGMQLLFDSSEEHGYHQGLGIFRGHVKRFAGDYKIPHMGWNELNIQQKDHPLFAGIEGGHVYFVHSYYVDVEEKSILLATTDYYQEVPAIVGKNHVIGMQFHPEKSGQVGMKLLDRFAKGEIA